MNKLLLLVFALSVSHCGSAGYTVGPEGTPSSTSGGSGSNSAGSDPNTTTTTTGTASTTTTTTGSSSTTTGGGSTTTGGSTTSACTTLTYANFGQTFLSNNCTSCHSAGGNGGVDLSSYSGLQTNISAVTTDITSGRMPVGATLDANSKANALTWLNCKAPQ